MSKVRCKFYVSAVEDYGGGSRKVFLTTQYDESIPEDQRFTKATPSGSIEMVVDNPAAAELLTAGTYFYVDFSKVEQGKS